MIHLRRERYQDLLLFTSQSESKDILGQGVLIQFQAGGLTVEEIARRARKIYRQ